jgi:hypothetical protein
MTLVMMFQINMIIQHRIELSTALIIQYTVSIILTQFHWISYSAHTPMSATLSYAYDPLLHDSITFSRESRYINGNGNSGVNGGLMGTNGVYLSPPHSRPTTNLRRGTSYGTMSNSPFDTVQELDEEQEEEDDQDVFIKVNVDRKLTATRMAGGTADSGEEDSDEGVEDEEEEQDMATLLAFQEQRRLKTYGIATTSTTTSPTALARSGLSPQTILNSDSGTPIKSPLSWAFRGTHDAFTPATSSYNVRMAASGNPGAAAVVGGGAAGGLTVGYGTPRRRPFKTGRDMNGTGRRTWTGGHSIIYSGIFVDDDSDDNNDNETDERIGENATDDLAGASGVDGEDIDVNESPRGEVRGGEGERHENEDSSGEVVEVAADHSQEQLTFDDTIKAEFDSAIKIEADTDASLDMVKATGVVDEDSDDVKIEVGSGATVKIGITETTKRATVRETKTVHRHSLKITGPSHSEDGSVIGDSVDVDGQLAVGKVVVVDGGIDLSSTSEESVVDDATKPHIHPQFVVPLPVGDAIENATAIDGPHLGMSTQSNGSRKNRVHKLMLS